MKPTSLTPPLICTNAGRPRLASVLIAVGLAVLGLAAARIIVAWQIPLPECGMQKWFDLPCFFCGGTRALLAFGHGEIGHALAMNPLVALGTAGAFGAGALAAVDRIAWPGLWARTTTLLRRIRVAPWFWMALAANWIYLLFALPR